MSAGGGGERGAARALSVGRYCIDNRTAETLEVVKDVRLLNSSTVSAIWYEGRSPSSDLQERLDIVCDAALFAMGRFVDSVISFQRSVKQMLTPASAPLILPGGAQDFTHQVRNAAFGHTGRWLDFCFKSLAGYVGDSLVHVRQRDVQGVTPAVLSFLYPCDEGSPETAAMRICLIETASRFVMDMPHPMLGLPVVVDTYRTALFVSEPCYWGSIGGAGSALFACR